ncbi:hypothetical protein FOMPIDRAFT_1031536 [Fomitopsis schrenkii]|uniref:DUF6697 domain-containing protein n=1 Tax=Fomitopsis schrenkii TaxID=2126942 RepID=S8F9U6_FOMSC|nr:hypothetical protein FOMPIDRAFT_1031536 [Fomitopsis schrenkii]
MSRKYAGKSNEQPQTRMQGVHGLDLNGDNAMKRPSGIDLNGDESAATTVELCLERLRLNDALSARDAVAQHLAAACVSVRQKTATIKTLEQEKSDLEMQLSFMNGRQEAALARSDNVGRTVQEREWTKVQVEVGALAEILRKLEHENKQLKTRLNGEEHDSRPSDWQLSLHRILRLVMPPPKEDAPRNVSSGGPPAPVDTPSKAGRQGSTMAPHIVDQGVQGDHGEGLSQLSPLAAPPDERSRVRNAVLQTLPLIPDTPSDVLKPIIIPPQYAFQDFVTALPVECTTSWNGEREEHGYFLIPLFNCTTNPRATTVHRWNLTDLGMHLNRTTECFFNKNGYWYYTGLYKTFWLDELSPAEWENLSAETVQALVKQTLAARKNTTPQNVYETGQLYAAGALRVGCIGLQCVGFSLNVYTQLIEAAERCAQTGRWMSAQGSCARKRNTRYQVNLLPRPQVTHSSKTKAILRPDQLVSHSRTAHL